MVTQIRLVLVGRNGICAEQNECDCERKERIVEQTGREVDGTEWIVDHRVSDVGSSGRYFDGTVIFTFDVAHSIFELVPLSRRNFAPSRLV